MNKRSFKLLYFLLTYKISIKVIFSKRKSKYYRQIIEFFSNKDFLMLSLNAIRLYFSLVFETKILILKIIFEIFLFNFFF